MSPILVRPVREQLEHDRIIRLLQVKGRRRYQVGINPGAEQNVPVRSGSSSVFPDVVLHSPERGRRLMAVVEVETGESVNHLEALAEWAHLAKLPAEFYLYVPSGMVDVARRLCDDNQIQVSQIWSYHTVAEDVRFTLVHRNREALSSPRSTASPARSKPPLRAKPRGNGTKRAPRGQKRLARPTVTKKARRK